MAGERNSGWPGFFRVFAVFAALMLLLAQSGQELVPISSGDWQVLSIYEGLTRWSVPALFMVWGMYSLEGGNKSALGGTLLTLALPAFCMLVFWGGLYAVVSQLLGGGALTLGGVWSALVSAAQGDTYFHLWILYPLIGLYLVHPLIQRFASSASRGEILYVLGLAFLFASALPMWGRLPPQSSAHRPAGALPGPHGAGLYGLLPGRVVFEALSPSAAFRNFSSTSWVSWGWSSPWRGPASSAGAGTCGTAIPPRGVALTAAALCTLFRYVLGVSEERSRRSAVYALGECVFGVYLFHQIWALVFRWFGVSPLPWGRWPRCRCLPWPTSCSLSPSPGCSPVFRGLGAGWRIKNPGMGPPQSVIAGFPPQVAGRKHPRRLQWSQRGRWSP